MVRHFPLRTVLLVLSEALLVLVAGIAGAALVLWPQDLESALGYQRGILEMALATLMLILCVAFSRRSSS